MYKFFAKTLFLGKKVYFLPECHSTNEEAQLMCTKEGAQEGLTVITPKQTRGKGQRGNKWESTPDKNLTFSVVLKPGFLAVKDQFHLHIITSLAIYDTLFPMLKSKLTIKWPNDIYYNSSKLAGILIENSVRGNRIEHAIVGIGLNVNQLDFNTTGATSLSRLLNQTFEPNELAELILLNLEKRYLQLKGRKTKELTELYQKRMYKFQSPHFFMINGEKRIGIITGISPAGLLEVSLDDQMYRFDLKEIEFLRD